MTTPEHPLPEQAGSSWQQSAPSGSSTSTQGAFSGRRVVLVVSGGIAAYKSVELCRRLVDAGAHVSPVMTEDAKRFIGEVTLSALASEPVQSSLWSEPHPIPHTRLGQTADVIVVAPATARIIAAYATGMSEGLATATLLATRAPVVVCPAMHTEMWEHPAVQDNLDILRRRGVVVVPPGEGRLAGGDVGAGRLAEPEDILAAVERCLTPQDLAGTSVLVTAGGTSEPIDPVRVITNRSTGRQGYAVAAEAAARGARVTLVTTVADPVPSGVEVACATTAEDMHREVMARAGESDVVVMAAAVADFRPCTPADRKLKKRDGLPVIELEPTTDILAGLAAARVPGQVLVGFAAETDEVEGNARAKLEGKKVDLVVANDVSGQHTGFGGHTNAVVILGADGSRTEVPLSSKRAVAAAVIDAAVRLLKTT
jgi:phosphopantothenoylcysteine decarboxylase / phosphopantothenate---cysteine ligase